MDRLISLGGDIFSGSIPQKQKSMIGFSLIYRFLGYYDLIEDDV
ncbi:hypothetical protein SCIP_0141 [Scardovia inopinata JCM 12537]|nr:hypothetical protein SCIP_0141 [Scardovia inopinata JCM 12537]